MSEDPFEKAFAAPGAAPTDMADGDQQPQWRPIVPVLNDVKLVIPPIGRGKPTMRWPYVDAHGRLMFFMCRFDREGEAKEFLPLTYCYDGGERFAWRWAALDAPRPLYGLDALAAHSDVAVIVVEGEKTVDAARKLFATHIVVTSANGARAAAQADWSPLAGREVTIWPDNDGAGRRYAADVARLATQAGAVAVRIVDVPGEWPKRWDLADPLPPGVTDVDLVQMLEQAREVPAQQLGLNSQIDGDGDTASNADGPCFISFGPYLSNCNGLFLERDNGDPLQICERIEVLAETRSDDGQNWGVLVRWDDHDGRVHEFALPRSALAGDGVEARRMLMDGGLYVAPQRAARDALTAYLGAVRSPKKAKAVNRIGWHDDAFVLPDRFFATGDCERLILQDLAAGDHKFRSLGTLKEWQEQIARFAIGNSRLVLAISCAFAGPLLDVGGFESGGVHFRGVSSSGKTAALECAGSVWGGGGINGFTNQWRATANALEGTAAQHSDTLLVLDELAQLDCKDAGAAAYLLANGQGKGRAGKTGAVRRRAQWRILFLSAGEIGLADKLAEDGRQRPLQPGQAVRVLDVPSDGGVNLGLFEMLHGFTDAKALVDHLKAASRSFYGIAAIEFIKRLTEDRAAVRDATLQAIKVFEAAHVSEVASGEVRRAGRRFALISAAGELACAFGILPWPEGEANRAAARCFVDWIKARGGSGPAEAKNAIRTVRAFLERFGDGRFAPADVADSPRIVLDRAGFKRTGRDGEAEFLILPEAWRSICGGINPSTAARALADAGFLATGSDGANTRSERIAALGKPTRVYVVRSAILEGDDE